MITSVEKTPCASLKRSLISVTCRQRVSGAFSRRTPAGRATILRILLKLYIYGYVNRVRSSRRLEAETTRNLEVIWLLRGLRPDFKTLADFRKDNRHAFKPVFRQFVLLCRKLTSAAESEPRLRQSAGEGF